MAVILAGALVAFFAASRVSRPLEGIVNDIRQIARGQLQHRSRVHGSAEIELLSRAINKMAEGLEEAQEAEIELGVREREMEVADEVRDALRPDAPPEREGYDIAVMDVGSPQPGGDFHDFIELLDGRIGLLVCSVSGQGVPGALIGATARAYLRSELSHGGDVADAFRKVNSALSRDVRRGMYVTAMYVLLDPAVGKAQVACAGHKIPLLRFCCGDGKMRTVQPEGIALGFDKGPVFDSRLMIDELALEAGDRLILSNTGPVSIADPDEQELGERGFYRMVLKYSKLSSEEMLAQLEEELLDFADDMPLPADISIVTVARSA
jgi:sigma-B regulation protein RsbU (phosphoserine phosphatase)